MRGSSRRWTRGRVGCGHLGKTQAGRRYVTWWGRELMEWERGGGDGRREVKRMTGRQVGGACVG